MEALWKPRRVERLEAVIIVVRALGRCRTAAVAAHDGRLDKAEVTGSSPVSPITAKSPRSRAFWFSSLRRH